MLLADVDTIAWVKLSHAYGKASDVPDLLRGLTSASAKARAEATFRLGASICHQGTLYRATAPAVPFLVELLASSKVKSKEAILVLLTDIATLDDIGPLLVSGAPPAVAALPASFKKAILAVRDGADTYVELLRAKDPAVRGAAAYLLAWLPNADEATLSALAPAIAREKVEGVKVSFALALAYAARRLRSKAPEAALRKLLASKTIALRAAGAIALAHLHAGDVGDDVTSALGAAAAKKKLQVDGSPWLSGDLASFAARVLAALPRTDATDALLLDALEAKGATSTFAANVLARRLFSPRKDMKKEAPHRYGAGARLDQEEDRALATLPVSLASLDARQRRLVDALAKVPDAIVGDLSQALRERGLPYTPTLLARWLGGSKASAPRLLDRTADHEGKARTLADLYVAAVKATGAAREAILASMRKATTPEEQLDLAIQALVEIDISWGATISLELVWEAATKAPAHVRQMSERMAKEGPPRRVTEHGTTEHPMCLVAVGVGLCAIALERGEVAPPVADALLQRAYGFWPRVRDALAALPIARREAWVLASERDDRAQPAEHFKGAWPYFTAVPTTAIADRALTHVKTWKPKDPWGGPRKVHADPLLAELVAALRAAGNAADADRCAQALSKL